MLQNYFSELPDHRRGQGRRYPLKEILLVSVLAILSGADSYRDITRFMRLRLDILKKVFGISWKKCPSKSVLSDIYCGLDKKSLEKIFRCYSKDLSEEGARLNKNGSGAYAIDGKALRGSFDHIKDNPMIHLLSVFCTTNDLIIAHVEIPEKTNEIPTAQALIKELGLPEGSVYTLDAMHCQKKHLKRLKKLKAS